MTADPLLFAAAPGANAPLFLALAAVFGTLGFYYLLPRAGERSLLWGTFLVLSAAVSVGVFLLAAFGDPAGDLVGGVLFWLFSAAAVGFSVMLVTNANPARGALAFAFVVLSSCGLFLLLAAPFLMAATVIIYAGAIIVTFLFVLMLSHVNGPSGENDRTRDPLLGSLAGFAFAGLSLFALHQTHLSGTGPQPPLTATERAALAEVGSQLRQASQAGTQAEFEAAVKQTRDRLVDVVGPATDGGAAGLDARLRPASAAPRVELVVRRAADLRQSARTALDAADNKLLGATPDLAGAKAAIEPLREDVAVLAGGDHLPARNVGTLGLSLYSEHLIAVELAGTLLLVATIGAVAIAQRKGAAS